MNDSLGVIVLAMLMLVVIAVFMGLPTMLLWNWLMPTLFGLKTITFWQAIGLNVLSGILFKSSASHNNSRN